MRILDFSDLHAHAWRQFSHITQEGVNSRLVETVKVIRDMHAAAVKHKADILLFQGDLVHKRDEVSTVLLNLLLEATDYLSNDPSFETYFLEGNHDQANNTNYSILSVFRHHVYVITEPTTLKLGGHRFTFHPWDDNRLEWRQHFLEFLGKYKTNIKCAFTHTDFRNVLYRGREIGQAPDASKLAPEIQIFSGHYHDHIVHENVVYIGAPIAHTWNDLNSDRGYLIIDIDKKGHIEWRRILTNYPRFIEIASLSEAKSAEVENNYVRIQATLLSTDTKEEIKKILQKRGAKGFIFYLIDEAKLFDDDEKEEVKKVTFNKEDIISGFVSKAKTGLNKKRLIKYGQEIMGKVEGA